MKKKFEDLTPEQLQTKLLGMIGFAKKAGKIIIGCELVLGAIRSAGQKFPKIVLVSADASENTKKRVENACKFYECSLRCLPIGGAKLGEIVGKSGTVCCVGITDDGFASTIRALLQSGKTL